jgi:hypothetical protein
MSSRVVFAILTALCLAAASHATVSTNWSAETALPKSAPANMAGGGVPNTMAVTTSGTVFLFYNETNVGTFKQFYTWSANHGANWAAPVEFRPVTPMPVGGSIPSVVVDTNDVIHVAWSSRAPAALHYARMDTRAPTSWSHYSVVATNPLYGRMNFNQITCDRRGRVHLFWQEGNHDNNAEPAEVKYARLVPPATNFTAPVMLSANDLRHSAFPMADLTGAETDTIAVAWRDNVNGAANWDALIQVSTNAGLTWLAAPRAVASHPVIREWDPQSVVDRRDWIHVLYHTAGSITTAVYYCCSTNLGLTWTSPGQSGGAQLLTPLTESHRLCKSAYDHARDIWWIFWKRSYFPGEDILGTWVQGGGRYVGAPLEYITDRGSGSAAFHNFAVGPDGLIRAHYHYSTNAALPAGTSVYYRERLSVPPPLAPVLTNFQSASGQMAFEFATEFGAAYQAEASTNLATWQDFGDPLAGNGGPRSSSAPTTGTNHLFIRVKASW